MYIKPFTVFKEEYDFLDEILTESKKKSSIDEPGRGDRPAGEMAAKSHTKDVRSHRTISNELRNAAKALPDGPQKSHINNMSKAYAESAAVHNQAADSHLTYANTKGDKVEKKRTARTLSKRADMMTDLAIGSSERPTEGDHVGSIPMAQDHGKIVHHLRTAAYEVPCPDQRKYLVSIAGAHEEAHLAHIEADKAHDQARELECVDPSFGMIEKIVRSMEHRKLKRIADEKRQVANQKSKDAMVAHKIFHGVRVRT